MNRKRAFSEIRAIAEAYVRRNVPAEHPWFDMIWEEMRHPFLATVLDIDDKRRSWLRRLLPMGFQFAQHRQLSLEAPRIIATLEAAFLDLCPIATVSIPSLEQIADAIGQRGRSLGLSDAVACSLRKQLSEPFRDLFSSVSSLSTGTLKPAFDAQTKPCGNESPITREYIPQDAVRPCIIWTSEAYGNGECGYHSTQNEADVLRKAMHQRFSIFVDGPSVYLRKRKGAASLEEIEIREELYRMLVILLRYKPRPVPSKELFLRITRQKQTSMDIVDIKQNHLRFLKLELQNILDVVPSLCFPRKSKRHGYLCKGAASYCVILNAHDASAFAVDLRVLEFPAEASASSSASR